MNTNISRVKTSAIGYLWLLACVCSLYGLQSYKTQPGQLSVDDLRRDSTSTNHGPPYRLIMFVHPKCPCTVASVRELDQIVRAAHGSLQVEVVAAATSVTELEQMSSAVLSKARALPHSLVRGEATSEAQHFGACTSGHLVVLDATGAELFRGGITRARGHEGASEGSRIVESILRGEEPTERTRPVYGCPLK